MRGCQRTTLYHSVGDQSWSIRMDAYKIVVLGTKIIITCHLFHRSWYPYFFKSNIQYLCFGKQM